MTISLRQIEESVHASIFGEDDPTAVDPAGVRSFAVGIRFTSPTSDVPAETTYNIRAGSPERAKAQALAMAAQAGYTNVSIIDVELLDNKNLVPSDSLNANPNALIGLVPTSQVTDPPGATP